MDTVVVKFGGSSLADAEQLKKVKEIILSDKKRRYVVPSAPGKRFSEDIKVTDLLYSLHEAVRTKADYEAIYSIILERFCDICKELGCAIDIKPHIEKVKADILNGESKDYAASRGEYLNGLIIADYLGFDFIDAANVIFFDINGKYDEKKTLRVMSDILCSHEYAVIPGFYGSLPDGRIKTFSRGGSDISGAIVAGAANASLYENWTDVSGFLTADPRIVNNPKKIDHITYRELRELSYMGATVLHEDSIFPVYKSAIPINVKNTNDPQNSGTMISLEREQSSNAITGIAGKKNFTVVSIEKNGMNSELGFGKRVLECFEKYGVPFEHMPSGIDTLCVVCESNKLKENANEIISDIHKTCEPDSVEITPDLALIATVGKGMISQVGMAAKLFGALAQSKINIRMIDQGSSEMNIIVGVNDSDFENAIIAIYNAFV